MNTCALYGFAGRLLTLASLVLATNALAKTLVIPLGIRSMSSGLLDGAVVGGRPGLSFSGSLAPGKFQTGDFWTQIAGEFSDSTDPRKEGWAYGLGAGVRGRSDLPGEVFEPSAYSWEAVLGRGTFLESDNRLVGFWGFLELGFRSEFSSALESDNRRAQQLQQNIRESFNSYVFRVGASRSHEGRGLVEQGPSVVGWTALFTWIFPAFRSGASSVGVEGRALTFCGTEKLSCGVTLHWTTTQEVQDALVADQVDSIVRYGPWLSVNFREKSTVVVRGLWEGFRAGDKSVWLASPKVNIAWLYAF